VNTVPIFFQKMNYIIVQPVSLAAEAKDATATGTTTAAVAHAIYFPASGETGLLS
jgi:hypothetical protein